MSTLFTLISVSNALAEISAGYAKLHDNNGRGGLPIGLQKGDGPLGTQLRPNDPPSASHDAYRPPCSDSVQISGQATRYAFAFHAQQAPGSGRAECSAQYTHRGSTEQGIVPAVWPYSNPFEASFPDQPYQPHRIPHASVKNLYNLNNPYPFAADINGRMLDVFA